MAAIRSTASMIIREIIHISPFLRPVTISPKFYGSFPVGGGVRFGGIRCMASDSNDNKAPSRLSQIQQLVQQAEERSRSAGNQPIPQITLDHVTVSFARSGGPGGQNVNKVNTKVDMRFNVKNAYWLSDRIRERIIQLEKNRINKDGEIVVSSTRTRTQKGNIDDALAKLQATIDAASYVPPPPSEEQKKKIAKMAAIGEQKRLQSKKVLSQKKDFRRSRNSWD